MIASIRHFGELIRAFQKCRAGRSPVSAHFSARSSASRNHGLRHHSNSVRPIPQASNRHLRSLGVRLSSCKAAAMRKGSFDVFQSAGPNKRPSFGKKTSHGMQARAFVGGSIREVSTGMALRTPKEHRFGHAVPFAGVGEKTRLFEKVRENENGALMLPVHQMLHRERR